MKSRMMMGTLLITFGIVMFLQVNFNLSGPWFLYALAASFLATHLVSGSYGMLIPGCIISGLAAGIHLTVHYKGMMGTSLFFTSLGFSFLLIYIIDRLRRPSSIWPLIPGCILTGFGTTFFAIKKGWIQPSLFTNLFRFWPVILIGMGLYLIIRSLKR